MNNSTEASRIAHRIRFVLMSVASFLLYALGVLTLHQDRAPGWSLEAQGPIPAAISYLVYGTPLGAVDDNVNRRFLQPDGSSVQELLATAAAGSIPRGPVDMYSSDAAGAGTNLFATTAMWMFGFTISSLVKLYLVFVGISVLDFILRFQDRRLFVLPLYFLVVTVMLITPLGTSAAAVAQMPIGGQRYFVLAAFLPALHVFFEIIERADTEKRERRIWNWALLFVQAILLFAVVLVRSSVSYLFATLLAVSLWKLWRERKQQDGLIGLWLKMAVVVAAFGFWAVFVVVALPAYVKTGRELGNFWHRAFISFSAHPDWPFGNLREVYDCTRYIPEGLNREQSDRNGHCIWWAYPPNQKRSLNDVMAGVYSAEYEATLRRAYFYVVTHYPRQTFELYFYVKSGLIENILATASGSLFELASAPVMKALLGIVATQGLLFIAFILALPAIDRRVVDLRLMIFPTFFLASLAPLYVAWANFWTSVDTVFLFYSCQVLVVLLLMQLFVTTIKSGTPIASQRAGRTSAPIVGGSEKG